jgi:hypothetical protein
MTGGPDFPQLVRTHIASVWALEVILLLRRDVERWWSAKALSDELRATVAIVDTSVGQFQRLGLVVSDAEGRHRYAAASRLLDDFCARLAKEYRERPVAIINLISAPEDRIQQLADAFRFRGDVSR